MLRKSLLAGSILLLGLLAYGSIFLPPPPEVFNDSDKWLHLAVYAGLGLLFAIQFPRHTLWVLVGCAAFGLALEWLQGFTPERQANLWDGAANAAGSMLGVCFARLLLLLKERVVAAA